ncbi:hypothetical protein QFZ63_000661 [Streptomyces sp. B3I7]|uniref:hypothetical protein n=1 Tax=Streptomyces sp. B3I7 TaxID=3042269 RepID=UPI00277FD4E1|nr:hypothetical protein [Streptomyces sp. B3I7]MDQ0808947.1 hypothetical protein [Streptomyces sp. B3I7]
MSVVRTGDGPHPRDFTVTDDDRESTVLTASRGTSLHPHRILRPVPAGPSPVPRRGRGQVTGTWQTPDGGSARGVFAVLYGDGSRA